jgi:hypothetical protein
METTFVGWYLLMVGAVIMFVVNEGMNKGGEKK